MLNPNVIVDALVAKMRDIPELVSALGSQSAIFSYQDRFPDKMNSALAIQEAPRQSAMVMWRGTSPGRKDRNEVWVHRLAIIIKANDPATVWAWIVNGVPDSNPGMRLTRVEVVPGAVYPMDTPGIDRRSIFIGQESLLDYLEASITISEKGDN